MGAAGAAFSARAQAPGRKVGFAVIGLGEIARHFMPGARSSEGAEITALVSGHRDKAERIAAEYNIPASSIYSYADFDRIRDNKAVDAVYVALPNSMHAEYTIRAAKAGKHVLCEKPMATTVEDAERMVEACKAAKVKLMIGYRMQYEPLHRKAIEIIRRGDLGRIQSMEAAFGFSASPGVWRLNKKLAGAGSLFDVGIYCLNASRYLSGEEPAAFQAFTSTNDHDGRFDEVEESVVWITRFPSGAMTSCSSTYGAGMPGYIRVFGSKGLLSLEPGFDYEGTRLRAHYGSGQPVVIDETNPEKDPMQFTREADHMAECIRQNRIPRTPGEEGLRDMRYMFQIYRAAGVSL